MGFNSVFKGLMHNGFYARSQNCKKLLLVSSYVSVRPSLRPSVRMK